MRFNEVARPAVVLVSQAGPARGGGWGQTYDVVFRAARANDAGVVEKPARLTVLQNETVVQNNVQVKGATAGGLDEQVGEPGPLLLQDHGNLVAYRNIWAVHLPSEGSDTYEPR